MDYQEIIAALNKRKDVAHIRVAQPGRALLDDFEGIGYKRILAAYILADQTTGVGYIYAIND